jgi:hypothetical protein
MREIIGWIRHHPLRTAGFGVVAVAGIVLFAPVYQAGAIWLASPGSVTISGVTPPPTDDLEKILVSAIEENMLDFVRWYRANMVLQSLLIGTSILATILAAITNNLNANNMKVLSVLLTAITAALTTVQSTFHIRENIVTFIKADYELEMLEARYRKEKTNFVPNSRYASLEALRYAQTKDWLATQSARMRAYSNIGQQPADPSDSLAAQVEQDSRDAALPIAERRQQAGN